MPSTLHRPRQSGHDNRIVAREAWHCWTMLRYPYILLAAVAACGGSPAAGAPATPPATVAVTEPVPPPPPLSGTEQIVAASALAEQYDAGQTVYRQHRCDSCHEADGRGNPKNPPVIGASALPENAPAISKLRASVRFTTAADVVAFVRTRMPIDKQGTLSDAEAYAVVAWMLDANKRPLDRPLDAATAAALTLR